MSNFERIDSGRPLAISNVKRFGNCHRYVRLSEAERKRMKVMRRYSNPKIWLPAFLLLIVATGCSDPDKTAGNPGLTPPTVISVAPPNGSVGACPSTIVTATFSKAMNPATIDGTTFTLTGPGTPPVAVAGVVTYDASSHTAIFSPLSALLVSTLYTATITTGATDAFGNALASNYVWSFTTGSKSCLSGPPTVISVTPADGVCPNTTVTATFSEAMNPSTINATTFTLTASGTAVAGTVAYDLASFVATFTPSGGSLVVNTLYTATMTTGAQDLLGDSLASDKVWTFMTSATACPGPIPLGPALCSAGILAGQAITSSGLSNVGGDLDISPLSSITGFPPGIYTGVEHIDDSTAANAQSALTTAYTTASTLPPGTSLKPDIGGSTLPPGVYTTVAQPSLGITGNLTLDPVGDPNAVWIFQISSTLTTAGGSVIVLPPGQSGNVYWAIGSAATLGSTTTMVGNLMAQAAITLNTGATLNGRALARSAGAVSVDAATINVPPCGP